MKKQNEERKIKVPESEYRNMKNAIRRQKKVKRIALELWQIFSNVEKPNKPTK